MSNFVVKGKICLRFGQVCQFGNEQGRAGRKEGGRERMSDGRKQVGGGQAPSQAAAGQLWRNLTRTLVSLASLARAVAAVRSRKKCAAGPALWHKAAHGRRRRAKSSSSAVASQGRRTTLESLKMVAPPSLLGNRIDATSGGRSSELAHENWPRKIVHFELGKGG